MIIPIYIFHLCSYINSSYHNLFIYHDPKEDIWLNEIIFLHKDGVFKNMNIYHKDDSIKITSPAFYERYRLTMKEEGLENIYYLVEPHQIVCRTWNTHKTYPQDKTTSFELEKSSVYFLYVEYFHPEMKYTIELTIPKKIYFVHNELFSSCFILRLLEKQNQKYIFDTKYRINIMDQTYQIYELFCYEYICLKQNHLVICKNESMLSFLKEEPLIYSPFLNVLGDDKIS